LPFDPDCVVHRSRDGQIDLEFRWPDAERLGRWHLRPVLLRDMLADVPDVVQHRVHYDA